MVNLFKMQKRMYGTVLLVCCLFLSGCVGTGQRIPLKDAESIMGGEYAYEDHTGITHFDITEEMPWYADMEMLCERVNRWPEKKMSPAAYYKEEEGKQLVTPEEIENSVVLQIRLPDTNPDDDIREYHTITFGLYALTENRCYLRRDDVFFRIGEDTEQTVTSEAWVIEDKTACDMIAGLEAAMRETAAEIQKNGQ